jgi:arginine/lysine/histidine transporter system substrate-binding protein
MTFISRMNRRRRWWLTLVAGAVIVVLAAWILRSRFHLVWNTDPTWARIQTNQVLRVGLDATYPPFETTDAQGQYQGYDIDLANALAARWGVKVQFVQIHFDGFYDALKTNKCDLIISALPYDRMMTRDVLYSTSYFALGQVLLVMSQTTDIKTWRDLAGHQVAVELGSEAHQLLRQLARDGGQEVVINAQREPQGALDALLSGQAQALVVDRIAALGYLRQQPDLRLVAEPREEAPLVIAASLLSTEILKQVNLALNEWRGNGLLKQLEERWF